MTVQVECSVCGGGFPLHDANVCPGGRWLPAVTRRDVIEVLSDVGTLGDAATLLGVRPNRVSNWAARHEDFPAPVGRVGRWPVYILSAIEAWADQRGPAPTTTPEV